MLFRWRLVVMLTYKQQKIAVALKSFLKLYDWVHFETKAWKKESSGKEVVE